MWPHILCTCITLTYFIRKGYTFVRVIKSVAFSHCNAISCSQSQRCILHLRYKSICNTKMLTSHFLFVRNGFLYLYGPHCMCEFFSAFTSCDDSPTYRLTSSHNFNTTSVRAVRYLLFGVALLSNLRLDVIQF